MPDITIYDTHKGNTANRRSVRRGVKDFVTFEMVSESLVKQEGSGMDKNPQIPFRICQENRVTLLGASETYKPLACISPCLLQMGPQRQCPDEHSVTLLRALALLVELLTDTCSTQGPTTGKFSSVGHR